MKLRLFVFLIILLVALYLLTSAGEADPLSYLFSPAHPSEKPLPQPWASPQASIVLASMQDIVVVETVVPTGDCPNEYSVQSGDTLSKIAARCGVPVADLQSLNPALSDPNRIYPGQELVIYGKTVRTEMSLVQSVHSAQQGEALRLEARGLPAGVNARVGIGLTSAGYRTLTQARVGEDGILSLDVVIPAQAVAGDHAFVMVTTVDQPSVQAMSDTFVIEP